MQTTTRHRQMPAPTSSDRGATYWKTILFGFADGFTRPSFAIFWRLVIAWVVCPGRHPITRLSLPAEPDGRRAHDAYHRFLRIGAWSSSGGDWRSWPSRALPTGQAAAGPTPPSRGGAGRWRAAAAPGPDALDRSGPGLRQPPQPPQRGPAASTRGWDAARAARLRAAVPPAGADPDRAGRGHAPGAGGVAPGAGVGGGGGRASCPLARAGLPRMVVVSRIRRNAERYRPDLPPRRPGQRGRPGSAALGCLRPPSWPGTPTWPGEPAGSRSGDGGWSDWSPPSWCSGGPPVGRHRCSWWCAIPAVAARIPTSSPPISWRPRSR